jgi:hypothetical protein
VILDVNHHKEIEMVGDILKSIRAHTGLDRVPGTILPSPAKGEDEIKRYYDTGIKAIGFSMEIWDENGQDQKAAFLDFPAGSDFALLNVYNDKTFMNDFLGYELFEKMGHYSVRRRYVEVFWNGCRRRAPPTLGPRGITSSRPAGSIRPGSTL